MSEAVLRQQPLSGGTGDLDFVASEAEMVRQVRNVGSYPAGMREVVWVYQQDAQGRARF